MSIMIIVSPPISRYEDPIREKSLKGDLDLINDYAGIL